MERYSYTFSIHSNKQISPSLQQNININNIDESDLIYSNVI